MKTKTTVALIPLLRSQPTGLRSITAASPPVTIPAPAYGRPVPTIVSIPATRPLSELIAIGRTYHPLCRHAFIEKRVTGYYHYERRVTWHTCALAAAVVGAYGPASIERDDFSYSEAIYLLARVIGYRADDVIVPGPTGRRVQPLADEIMQLVDFNMWSRAGVATWLEDLGL
ncbi:MAG: hypothetical protein KF770_17590 [Anaerolineae bacterium]|nr:hypothetical protein [Anaerolineae bacterium]